VATYLQSRISHDVFVQIYTIRWPPLQPFYDEGPLAVLASNAAGEKIRCSRCDLCPSRRRGFSNQHRSSRGRIPLTDRHTHQSNPSTSNRISHRVFCCEQSRKDLSLSLPMTSRVHGVFLARRNLFVRRFCVRIFLSTNSFEFLSTPVRLFVRLLLIRCSRTPARSSQSVYTHNIANVLLKLFVVCIINNVSVDTLHVSETPAYIISLLLFIYFCRLPASCSSPSVRSRPISVLSSCIDNCSLFSSCLLYSYQRIYDKCCDDCGEKQWINSYKYF